MSRFATWPRNRQRLLLVGFVAVLSALLLLGAETAVRVRQYVKYGHVWGVQETYRTDPATGLRMPIPGGRFGEIRINSLGFRGPEIAVPKPASTVRLAFVGASTTYCAESTTEEATWPYMVWKALSERWPDVRFDYVNAGVPGYGVADSLRNLELRVRPLQPDVVLIYHATNDLSWNSFERAREQGLVEEQTEKALSRASRYSLLWYLVEKNLAIRREQSRARADRGKLAFDPDELARPFHDDLRALVEASQRVADVVVLITFSQQLRREQSPEAQVQAAVTSLYYMPYMSIDGLLDGFDAYNRAIRAVADETGALLVANEDAIPGDPVHFNDSVHFTDTGNAAMATRVAEAVVDSPALRALVDVEGLGGS